MFYCALIKIQLIRPQWILSMIHIPYYLTKYINKLLITLIFWLMRHASNNQNSDKNVYQQLYSGHGQRLRPNIFNMKFNCLHYFCTSFVYYMHRKYCKFNGFSLFRYDKRQTKQFSFIFCLKTISSNLIR